MTSSAENLQDMLRTVDQYSRRYRFEFNAKKSNVMVFSQQQIKTATTMQLGDSVLEEKMSYKYLGLEGEKDWKWKQTKAGCWRGDKKTGDSVLGIRWSCR